MPVYSAGPAPLRPATRRLRSRTAGCQRCPNEPTNPTSAGGPSATAFASGCVRGRGAPSWPVAVPRAVPDCRPDELTSRNDVARVLTSGRAFHGDRVVVFVAPGSGTVAFVAGRRVGGAVVRNRARRILRAAWWELAPRVREGFDIALVARGTICATRSHELVPEVEGLLTRAGVMAS